MRIKRVMLMAEWQVGHLVHGVVNYAHSHNWHLILWHSGSVRSALRNWRGDGIIASRRIRPIYRQESGPIGHEVGVFDCTEAVEYTVYHGQRKQ